MTGRERIAQLKVERPDVVIEVVRTPDPYSVWDGDEPIGDEFVCYDHDVIAYTIRDGERVEGRNSLGGSWYDPFDKTPENLDCLAEISGYLLQMVDEALEELDGQLPELMMCEICGEPAGAGGALCPVHLREAGIE
jgi:hypothetical protein